MVVAAIRESESESTQEKTQPEREEEEEEAEVMRTSIPLLHPQPLLLHILDQLLELAHAN